MKNKPLELLKDYEDDDNYKSHYVELLSAIGRKDHVGTISVLEEISTKVELEVTSYDVNMLDNRLKELWIEAQTQLNSWDTFVIAKNLKNPSSNWSSSDGPEGERKMDILTNELLQSLKDSENLTTLESIINHYIKEFLPGFEPTIVPDSLDPADSMSFLIYISMTYYIMSLNKTLLLNILCMN